MRKCHVSFNSTPRHNSKHNTAPTTSTPQHSESPPKKRSPQDVQARPENQSARPQPLHVRTNSKIITAATNAFPSDPPNPSSCADSDDADFIAPMSDPRPMLKYCKRIPTNKPSTTIPRIYANIAPPKNRKRSTVTATTPSPPDSKKTKPTKSQHTPPHTIEQPEEDDSEVEYLAPVKRKSNRFKRKRKTIEASDPQSLYHVRPPTPFPPPSPHQRSELTHGLLHYLRNKHPLFL